MPDTGRGGVCGADRTPRHLGKPPADSVIGVDQQPERRDPAAAVPYPLRVASAVSWRILVVAAALTVLGYVIINLTVVFIPLAVGLLLTALLGPAPGAAVARRGGRDGGGPRRVRWSRRSWSRRSWPGCPTSAPR